MRALVLLTGFICFSCTKYSVLSRDAMGLHINGIGMEIFRVDEIPWKVGKRKEATVSQSFMFLVETPKLRTKDLEYLTEQRGIDSWIMKVIHQKGSERRDLGSIFVPFRTIRSGRAHSSGQAATVALKVFYAAAYASERFRSFHCPAFNHNKRINSLKILGTSRILDMNLGPITSYKEKAQKLELTPNAFNGGNSLAGEFHVEFAPYDSERKLLHASFMRLPQYVEVQSEENLVIDSCRGENPEFEPRR